MKTQIIRNLSLLALMVAAAAAFATTPTKLAPAADKDVRAEAVIALPMMKRAFPVSRDSVEMNWALDQNAAVEVQPQPHIAESKGFWQVVDSAELNDGIALPVTEAGALVRISPVPGPDAANLDAIPATDVVLVSEAGEAFSLGRGTEALLDPNQMQAKDTPFPAGSSVFYISDAVGTGNLTLFAERIDPAATTRYVVHVFERDSDVALHAQAGRDTYFAGQTVHVGFELSDAEKTYPAMALSGRITDPAGNSYPMTADRNGVEFELANVNTQAAGLWQVELTVEADVNGTLVRRDARTAFAVGQPTARLLPDVAVNFTADAVTVDLNVEAGTPGRFEVRAMLFGTDANGNAKPIAISHAADWLTPGNGLLTLRYDADLLEASGLSAPYMIKDLRLIHQDAFSLLHRQADALTIEQ